MSPDETVAAVDAVSAVEPPQPPDGVEDADESTPDADTDDVAADHVAASVAAAGLDDPSADPKPSGDSGAPAEPTSPRDPRPAGFKQPPKQKPAPTFTAAKPGERPPTPTFSAARPDQAGTAQRTPKSAASGGTPKASSSAAAPSGPPSYWPAPAGTAAKGGSWSTPAPAGSAPQHGSYSGAPTPAAGPQYAGPSQPYTDLAAQYPPAPVGGSGRRRGGARRWIILAICAVLVAAAIGAGTALALRHNGGSSGAGTTSVVKGSDPVTKFGSVNALNAASTALPSGWTAKTVTPATDGTTAGFTIDVPPGWTEKPSGLGTFFYGPHDMVLEIDLTAHQDPGNMVAEAERIEQESIAVGRFPDYKRAQLTAVPVRGAHGAFWQFTWSLNGLAVRTDDILFVLSTSAGDQSYACYLRAPDNGWGDTYLPIFEKILPTFAPVTD